MSALEIGTPAPSELQEYLYRKEFGYTHKEFNEIGYNEYAQDLTIMSIIEQYKQHGRGNKN